MQQLTFVLDCSNCMLHYVDHFKKGALKVIQDQDIKMEIAFVIYRANNDENVMTSIATEIKEYPFKSSGSYTCDIIPSRESTLDNDDKVSLEPINVHGALHKALKFEWKESAEKRTLILIAKNPPHGIQYHELGKDADLYPEGVPYPLNNHILNAIAAKQIHFFIINVDNVLKYFCNALMATPDHKGLAHKWVKCIEVQNEDELTHKLLDCVVGNQDRDDLKSNEDIEDPLRDKDKPHDLVRKMRWVKQPMDRGGEYYPVLVLSVDKDIASVWDGASVRDLELTNLYQRSDLIGDAHGVRKSDKGVRVLLARSHATQQTLNEERQQGKEQSEKSKASAKNGTKQIEKLIHSKITAHSNIKWMKKDHGYQPVLVIQQGDTRYQRARAYVLDIYNEMLIVRPTSLLDTPPYETAQHIANHVAQLDRLCANYPWKHAVECGTTQCSWTTPGAWGPLSSDKIHTGTILGIKEVYKRDNDIQYRVKKQDNGKILFLWDYEKDFQVLGLGDKTTTQLKDLQKENDQLKSQNETLTSTKNGFASDIRRLTSTNNQLSRNIKGLKKEIQTFKETVASLRSDNDHFLSRIRKSKKDIASQNDEIKDLKMECHRAITRKDDFEKKFTTINNVYDRLKQESDQLKQKNQEQRQLVTKLREDKLEESSTLDLSRGFPPVQDIVEHFATLKSHYHVEAARPMKKVLKQRHKEYSRLRNYKLVCEILFDILMESYRAMQAFEPQQYQSLAETNKLDMNNEKHKKRLEKMVKEQYNVLIGKSKKDKARSILDNIKELHGMNDYLKDDTKLLQYTEQCIAICWMIVLVRDPMLVIEPQQFDRSDEAIDFDEQCYFEGWGSEDNHPLYFVVWPSIERQDTEENISKITGVFVKDIPQWNKKKMRKMQAEKKEQDRDSDRKEDEEELMDEKKKKKKKKKKKVEKVEKEESGELAEEEGKESERRHLDAKEGKEDVDGNESIDSVIAQGPAPAPEPEPEEI